MAQWPGKESGPVELRIVILGAPGAGKGTQAKQIAAEHGIPHVSTGAIFRAHMENKTDLGMRIEGLLDAGHLVPDEITCGIVRERLDDADCAGGYVLDGFPRSVPQAEALEQITAASGKLLDAVVEIRVNDDVIVERLTARRTCAKCGAIFNMKSDPPEGGGASCDREGCAGELTLRDDDREETIRERQKVYHETTEPLLGFYRERGLLRTVVEAGLPPEGVYAKIEKVLDEMGEATAL
jgi:adenylate kinase